MSHHLINTNYTRLIERLNRFPQGAPSSHLLYKILEILFSEKEAGLVSLLPVKPFTAEKASAIWKLDITSSRKILDELSARAILIDYNQNESQFYVLPPPMAGFFEFSLMRIRNDIDQKVLSELFYEYINVKDDFVKALFLTGETQIGRVFVNEPAIDDSYELHVLDFERASEVIKSASHIGISICYCRHKMKHVGRACEAPLDICMTFNTSASSLIKQGFARGVEISECMELLHKAYELNLVQFGENVRKRVNFICNCCSCCCEGMIVARRFGMDHPVHTTNYLPKIKDDVCTGCGKCVAVCPVGAIRLVSAGDIKHSKLSKATVNEEICLGCGLCKRVCPSKSIYLAHRSIRVIPPYNTVHRTVAMAIERENLHDLIFDNKALSSHRLFSSVLKSILELPLLKRAVASKQIKSRFFEAIFSRYNI
ncbi:MAG: 4Fe-4S binding protein [Desulfobacterales bacterium]